MLPAPGGVPGLRSSGGEGLGAEQLPRVVMAPSLRKHAESSPIHLSRSIGMDDVIAIAHVIGCPARLRIYRMLGERGRAVGEVARMARVSQSTASWHLARLSEVGLVEAHRRGRQTIYRPGPLLYSIAVQRVAE